MSVTARVWGKVHKWRALLMAIQILFWFVDDGANRALYVAQNTGTVTARGSTLWRVFDFLWSLPSWISRTTKVSTRLC